MQDGSRHDGRRGHRFCRHERGPPAARPPSAGLDFVESVQVSHAATRLRRCRIEIPSMHKDDPARRVAGRGIVVFFGRAEVLLVRVTLRKNAPPVSDACHRASVATAGKALLSLYAGALSRQRRSITCRPKSFTRCSSIVSWAWDRDRPRAVRGGSSTRPSPFYTLLGTCEG